MSPVTGVNGTNGGIGLVNLTEVFGGTDGPGRPRYRRPVNSRPS